MQQDNKLRIASLLMILSILLLVLLQVYWLRNAWFGEYRRLKRDVSVTLRETVTKGEIRQFLLLKAKETSDTLFKDNEREADRSGSVRLKKSRGADSAEVNASFRFNVLDTARRGGRPRILSLEEGRFDERVNPRRLIVEFPALLEGSNLDSTRKNYKQALTEAGINLSFVLTKSLKGPGDSGRILPGGEIRISDSRNKQNHVRIFNSEMIRAEFENPFWYVLKQIAWQIVFALIMIVVTTAAFVFLYRSLVQQKRLSDLKNDFIANITHELKTPIATVGVAIEALKNFDAMQDADKTKEYLDISGNELNRLNLLVDKVLRLSMLGQKQLELQKEKIDLRTLLGEVINSLKLQFEKQDAQVSIHTEGMDFITMGDRMHLLSVFYNLLDNALKYSPEQPVISVSLQSSNGKISVRIKDNGIGISAGDRPKIFDKFYRVPHGNTHNIKGYGLGLSYVNEVVKAHGGSITVDSKEGKGSEFIVTLEAEQETERET